MANEDVLKRLEERLTRLEATLAQAPTATFGGFTPPGGAVVDPAPWGGGWSFHPRWPWPHPVVDPGPWPRPVVDPVPWPRPIADPAPTFTAADLAAVSQARAAASLGRIGTLGGDPPPPDISRFTAIQLEATLHSIAAEKTRLTAMETMVKQQLEKVKQQG
jgi:hypothetical protein